MKNLDYPKDKLQIILLLEEDDQETIIKIQEFNLPSYFEIVIVPPSSLKTKPRACNYGLTKTIGEYVVIYDAEDIPDPLQLKKAIVAFRKTNTNVVCVQAKLSFYNPYQNILTRLFTAEYLLWFDLILPGLQSINAPIPLGGTSNIFKTYELRKLGGWDSFSVTEDCDLGMRLIKQGYNTVVINSITFEEANANLKNWLFQRSRWMKGYMQVYLVHMRNLSEFNQNSNKLNIFIFQLIVGGKILSAIINPFLWIITILYFIFREHIGLFIESFFYPLILYIGTISLIFGNFLFMYYYIIACVKNRYYELVKYIYLIPFYWLFVSMATWIALYELVVSPHRWRKTEHGKTLLSEI